jgi:hypothetical protein
MTVFPHSIRALACPYFPKKATNQQEYRATAPEESSGDDGLTSTGTREYVLTTIFACLESREYYRQCLLRVPVNDVY